MNFRFPLFIFVCFISSFFFVQTIFAQTTVSGNITTNTTWTTANSPYIVTGDVTVNAGVTLTVDPGVVVKFNVSKSLNINGNLVSQGQVGNAITYTSNLSNPAQGNWQKVQINATSTGSIVEYSNFQYSFYGLVVNSNTFPTIQNNVFSDNVIGLGLSVNTFPAIENSSFSNNQINLSLSYSSSTIPAILNASNNWWGTTDPQQIYSKISYGSNSLLTVNVTSFLDGPAGNPIGSVAFGYINGNQTWSGTVFVPVSVTINTGSSLTVSPGSVVKFLPNGANSIVANGNLISQGVAGNPIIYTSNSLNPAPANWDRIQLNSTSTGSVFEYSAIKYGNLGLYLNNVSIPLPNNSFENNFNNNLYLDNSSTSPQIINASNTWWGTTDPVVIRNKIYAGYSGNSLITVNISSFLDAPWGNPIGSVAFGFINGNQTWSGTIFIASTVTINTGANLTIAPGSVVKFTPGISLNITANGNLISQGTATNPITYTSNSATPAAGNWNYIRLKSTSTGSVFEYSTVEYAQEALFLEDVYPTVQNNSFSNNQYQNLYISSSTTTPITINASNNWWGTTDPVVIRNKIYTGYGVNPLITVNVSSVLDAPWGNPIGSVAFGYINGNQNWSGTVFVPATVTINTGANLTVAPGTVVKFTPALSLNIIANGNLISQGTALNPITYTSNATTPAPGNWGYIKLNSTASGSVFQYSKIEYSSSGLYLDYVYPAVENNSFSNNSNHNLYVYSSATATTVATVNATNNWWGTTDPTLIYSKLAINGWPAGHPYSNQFVHLNISNILDAPQGNPIGSVVFGNIPQDFTWNGTVFVAASVNIQSGKTLTISPGTVVKFVPALSLNINADGNLISQGTVTNPITYTSNAAIPAPGNWSYIRLKSTSTGSVFEYSSIEYSQNGLFLDNVYPAVQNNSFSNNLSENLYISSSTTTPITINASNNWWGTTDPVVIRNKIYTGYGVNPLITVNVSSILDAPQGNPIGSVAFGYINGNQNWSGTVYVPSNVTINTGANLTVAPGSVVKFTPGISLNITANGNLISQGTVTNPITYTSNSATPAPGNWSYIRLKSTSTGSVFEYSIVEYSQQALFLEDVYPAVQNNSFSNNQYQNLYISSSTTTPVTINASNNWWGTTDPVVIRNKIYTGYGGNPLIFVSLSPVLDGPWGNPIGSVVFGNINGSQNWSGTVYVASTVTVNPTATLTVSPGTIVKFPGGNSGVSLLVDGILISQGQAGNPITYTSNSTTHGPYADWGRIALNATATGSIFEYSIVEYSGDGLDVYLPTLTILNSTFRYCSWTGVAFWPASAAYYTINNSSFYGNGANGFENTGGNVVFYNYTNPVTVNTSHSWWGSTNPTDVGNKFKRGYSYPASLLSIYITSFLDAPQGNPIGSMALGSILENLTWSGTAYVVETIGVNTGATLTITPGTRVNFLSGSSLNASGGTINAAGTLGNEIVFTSGKLLKALGDWGQIKLGNTSIIDHAIVEYSTDGVLFDGSSGIVQNSLLKKNTRGISVLNSGSPQILNNSIRNNVYGIYVSTIQANPANPTITNNLLYNNSSYNLYANNNLGSNTVVINAPNNWWGSSVLSTINASIYDQIDHPYSPLINITPFNTTGDIINITNNSVVPKFFTPSPQSATINYTLDQPSNVFIKIYSSATGYLVRTLLNSQPRSVGANSEMWDGLNDTGIAVPANVYFYTISALNITTGAWGDYDPVYTSGTVQITNGTLLPVNFDPFKGEVATVTYNLAVPGYVTLRVGNINSPISRTLLNNIPRDITNNVETWDGRDDSGNLITGNISVYGWAYLLPDNSIVAQGNLDVSSIKSDPYVIYPLYGGATQIQYTLSTASNVTVDIISPTGSVVKNLLNNQLQTAGTQNLIWDGKNGSGAVVGTQGNYNIKVTASDSANINSVVKSGNIRVVK